MDGGGGGRRPRAVFMAFGTRGDVFPIAALAAAFAQDQRQYSVVFITHSAHQTVMLDICLCQAHLFLLPNSSRASHRKKIIQVEHRKECLSAVENVFGNDMSTHGDFIVINFFALEGWHLAELFQVKCIIAAPYFVPYSAPASFERQFKQSLPLLYKYFQEAPLNMDPVTNLPLWYMREESPLLLYGFSKEIVECPGYWPFSAHVCGFWFLPMAWQFSCNKCKELLCGNASNSGGALCVNHAGLEHFTMGNSYSSLPIFIGLSSIGSMGFLRNPKAFLMVLKAVIEKTDYRFILFSSGYQPLDSAIQSFAPSVAESSEYQASALHCDSNILFNGRLFCFSGWLFPKCAIAIHHAGSGSTAAALFAGIPQISCPFLLDQFYWAERLHWLGVAPEPLRRQHLILDTDNASSINNAADMLIGAIKSALSPEIKAQATRIANKLSSEDGIGEALRILKERVLPQSES
uniref:Erythromycin biosynthesis protein CIII-like C-terminal domain-containing protein n=1 Tax=Oryza meridionalis TaxID=40149 RepID=A0A0E0CHJ0_9ORYZ